MRILLVVDGSPYSYIATQMLEALQLSPRTEVAVLTVVPKHTILGRITLYRAQGGPELKRTQQHQALELVARYAAALKGMSIKVETLVRWGNAGVQILRAAKEHKAALIIMGSKSWNDLPTLRLSVAAQTVMRHAKASVLLVRENTDIGDRTTPPRKKIAINRILLATDNSRQSDNAVRFLLELPLPQPCEVIVVTALHSQTAALIKTPTLDLQTNQELMANLQTTEEREAQKIVAHAEKQFQAKGYRAASVVIRGGPAESILAAAKEYKPDIIALGSQGMNKLEILGLGNVAGTIARYANCSVLIGRTARHPVTY